jgi:hypothetical protein
VVLGNVHILVHSGPEIDPYFSIPLPDPLVGWRKAWFLLRNDADPPLPTFMGWPSRPHPNWEYSEMAHRIHGLQPLLEIVHGLLQKGLMGKEILRTFFSRRMLHQ